MHFPTVKKLSVLVWTEDLNALNFKGGQGLYLCSYLFVCVTLSVLKLDLDVNLPSSDGRGPHIGEVTFGGSPPPIM